MGENSLGWMRKGSKSTLRNGALGCQKHNGIHQFHINRHGQKNVDKYTQDTSCGESLSIPEWWVQLREYAPLIGTDGFGTLVKIGGWESSTSPVYRGCKLSVIQIDDSDKRLTKTNIQKGKQIKLMPKEPKELWRCEYCGSLNLAETVKCANCGAPRKV